MAVKLNVPAHLHNKLNASNLSTVTVEVCVRCTSTPLLKVGSDSVQGKVYVYERLGTKGVSTLANSAYT